MGSGNDIHLYMSCMGDSLHGVAAKFSPDQTPKGIAEYLEVMRRLNSFNQQGLPHIAQSPQFPMFQDTCVYLPNLEDLKQHRDKSLEATLAMRESGMLAIRQSNMGDWQTRENIGMVASDHDLPTIAAIASLKEALQVVSQHKAKIGETGLVGVSALGEQMADYVLDGAENVQKALLNAQDKLIAFTRAAYGEKTLTKKAYFEAHHLVKERVNEYIQRYGENRVGYLRKVSFISNREKWLSKIKIGGDDFNVMDTDEFQSIIRVMSKAKGIKFGWMAIPLALIDVPEIHHLYKTGGDWVKETLIDAGGIGGGIGGGLLTTTILETVGIGLAAVSGGWIIAIVVGAIGCIAGEEGGKILTEWIIDKENQLEL